MSIFNQQEVTLNELKQHLEVLDGLQDGEMVDNVRCTANGTYPREGHRVDQNGVPYRWHNFLVVEGRVFDQLKDEYGMDTSIDWQTLYDAGLTSSEFERDLNKEVPRGAAATVTVQKQGEELNILRHEIHIKDAATVARFHDEKQSQGGINTALTEPNENGETEEEMEPETA